MKIIKKNLELADSLWDCYTTVNIAIIEQFLFYNAYNNLLTFNVWQKQ